MKSIIATIAFAAALATTAPAEPANFRESGRGLFWEIVLELKDLRDKANLTEGQRTGVKSVLQSHKPEISAQMEKGRDARRAMQRAVEANGPDSPEVLKAADAVADAARSRALLTAKIASEIKPLLTAEQIARAKATRERIEDAVDARFSE